MKSNLLFFSIIILLAGGCKKDSTTPSSSSSSPVANAVTFNLSYEVDGKALLTDTLLYITDAAYHYSVSKLQYYLSEISLIKQDSSRVKILDYHYADALIGEKNSFTINNIPGGNYIGICFNIGLDSAHNITGILPNITDNDNMEWPAPMGGGYHFLKFEGHYLDTAGLTGFTMHLGTNTCLVKANPLYKPFTIDQSAITFNLTMNLNEWFRNPAIYDFDMDGNFTMGNMMAMEKLAANGSDVFHFKN